MTTLTLGRAGAGSIGADALAAFFRRMATTLARRRAYRDTRRQLAWLTDRELADLGIMRCDIDAVSRAAARLDN
jgi:uncharacterized protein YjiS (DUF1127 family)